MIVKRLEKKKLILSAAADCFYQSGYEKTTLDEIGSKVNLNKASLYYYYNSKENIFSDVIFAEAGRFHDEFRKKMRGEMSLEDKVILFLLERAEFYKRISQMQFLPLQISGNVDPLQNTVMMSIQMEEKNILSAVLEEGIRLGELSHLDSNRLAEVFLKVSTSFQYPGLESTNSNDPSTRNSRSLPDPINIDDIKLITRLILRGAMIT